MIVVFEKLRFDDSGTKISQPRSQALSLFCLPEEKLLERIAGCHGTLRDYLGFWQEI